MTVSPRRSLLNIKTGSHSDRLPSLGTFAFPLLLFPGSTGCNGRQQQCPITLYPPLLENKIKGTLWKQPLGQGWCSSNHLILSDYNCGIFPEVEPKTSFGCTTQVGASADNFSVDLQAKKYTNTHKHTQKETVEETKQHQADTGYTKSCIIQICVLLCRVYSNFCLSQTQIHLHADLPALLLW